VRGTAARIPSRICQNDLMRTTLALICLTAPALSLALVYVRENGPRPGGISTGGICSLLAAILLLAHFVSIVNGPSAENLAADFFPSRAFLFYAVSGLAYGAAMFPQLLADKSGVTRQLRPVKAAWLIAIPGWLWIVVLIILAAVGHGA
jgi:hypothetical protein